MIAMPFFFDENERRGAGAEVCKTNREDIPDYNRN